MNQVLGRLLPMSSEQTNISVLIYLFEIIIDDEEKLQDNQRNEHHDDSERFSHRNSHSQFAININHDRIP